MGWKDPFPLVLGGGSDVEDTWLALRALTGGETGGPGPVDGIDDSLRQAKATAIVMADRSIERAFLQNFPALATDGLPEWEGLLNASAADTEVQLRAALVKAWLPAPGSTTPSLVGDLTAISPKLSIALEDPDEAIATMPGKYVAPDDNLPIYTTGAGGGDGHVSGVYPNFATVDILRVVYALDPGETDIPAIVSTLVRDLLHRRLRADQTWTLGTLSPDGPGFFCDGGAHGDSLLDLTPLS